MKVTLLFVILLTVHTAVINLSTLSEICDVAGSGQPGASVAGNSGSAVYSIKKEESSVSKTVGSNVYASSNAGQAVVTNSGGNSQSAQYYTSSSSSGGNSGSVS